MAKRESQGMQITVILLVMLSVLFAITTVVFWNISKNAKAAAESSDSKARTAQDAMNKAVQENQSYREFIGHPVDADFTNVETVYKSDMLKFGSSYPEKERSYRKLPEFLGNTNQELHNQLATLSARVRELEKQLEDNKTEKEKHVGIERTAKENAEKEYRKEREQFNREMGEQKKQYAALKQKVQSERDQWKGERRQLATKIETLEGQLSSMTIRNDRIGGELAQLKSESFEQPDGKITWVDQSGEYVYINLGRGDALQRQVSFSVYDVDENNLARTEKKASIEVTRLLGDHLAEARVLQDDSRNPILRGDIIFSPVWELGSPIRFALSGFMDIDGDGKSDRDLVRRMIKINGGEIDAEVSDEGTRTGTISVRTRYLVTGDDPKEKSVSSGAASEDIRIRDEAKGLGISIISVERLLSDLGYQKVSKTIALGKSASDVDYRRSRFDPGR